jgi:hypothetical protein
MSKRLDIPNTPAFQTHEKKTENYQGSILYISSLSKTIGHKVFPRKGTKFITMKPSIRANK